MRRFDEKDAVILSIIQETARISNAEIARRVGLAPSAVLERIRKLEKRGVIRGYEARLCPHCLGSGLLAYIFVRTQDRVGEGKTAEELARIPEVQEVHHVAGEDCYLVKVRVADTFALGRLLKEKLASIPTVHSTRSTVVLDTVKETGRLVVENPEEEHHVETEAS